MKYLKYLLYIVIGIILLYLLLCAAGPKNMNVSKSTEIIAPASIVYNLSNSLQEMEKWNEWSLSDSTVKTTFNDVYEGVGAASSWTSKASGSGTQKIVESIPHKKVRSSLIFKGWSGENFADIDISQTGAKTNVSWSFDGAPIPYWIRGMALVTGMKREMNTYYEKGLKTLKRLSEERAGGLYDGYDIREEILEEKHFIMNRQEVKMGNIQQFYAGNLGSLFGKVQAAGIEMSGMPCGLFFKLSANNNVADMAAAIPVSTPVAIEGAASYSIPAQKAVLLDFYGDYNTIEKGLTAIEKFMKDRDYLQDPPIIEEYVTDPATETDPNKWLTKVTYYYTEAQQ